MTILREILAGKPGEVAARRAARPIEEVRTRARAAPAVRSLRRALEAGEGGFRVIAEVKKASPSKGVIRADFDPAAIAGAYSRGGAAAISVLTDERHFQGGLSHLEAVRRSVDLPVLRKDFIVDAYQIWEARAAGADAVLLIVAAFEDDGALRSLAAEAEGLGMDVLWEVHDLAELRRALPFRPKLIGINNRDLRTFDVSLETTRRLLPEVPTGVISVSESGFSRREELEMMRGWGAGAFLIGESLLRARDPGAALAELIAPAAAGRSG